MNLAIKDINKRSLIKLTLILAAAILSLVSLSIGAEEIIWSEAFTEGTFSRTLLFKSRIPRTISLLISGFGMSIIGLIFQQISRNKFVSPTTAGSVSGAQLGIAISLVFFSKVSTLQMMLFGFVSSLAVTGIFMYILRRLKFKEVVYVPLLGLMLGSVISSITSFLAYKYNFLQVLYGWFYGSFSLAISGRYELLYLIIPTLFVSFFYAKAFTIAGLGENFSTNLGLNYRIVVNIGLVLISAVSGAIVIVVGNIPFLGLVVPNIVSLYGGDNLEKNISIVGLTGMIFILCCDLICRRIIYPYELPIALVVGVIGCGLFLMLIFRKEAGSYET